MAEAMLRTDANGRALTVTSAGVAAMPGSEASRETREIVEARGGDLGGFRSRMVDDELLAEVDFVFCMTRSHLEALEALYPDYSERYYLACDFVEIGGEVGVDIPDPIGGGRQAYEAVATILDGALDGILGFLDSEAGEKG